MFYAFLLALALCVDTFVLAISIGLSLKQTNQSSGFKLYLVFGVVQAGLFGIGRLISTFLLGGGDFEPQIKLHISSIVFAVLAIKMFLEFIGDSDDENSLFDISNIWKIAILTSIDALIVGVTPLNTNASSLLLVSMIFIASTIASLVGIEVARNLKKVNLIEHYSLLIGAILLALLAIESF